MRATKASAASESNRMFDSDFLEFFSRIPPWQPPAIYIPLIAYASYVGLFDLAIGFGTFAALAFGGIIFWTLMEYWLHRVLFHWDPKGPIGKKFIWYLHGVHHDWPNDKLRLVFPPTVSLPLAALFWAFFTATVGDVHRWPTMVGLMIGYLTYDMTHYWVHHFAPKSRFGKFLRRYHLEHHFKNPYSGYGVSSPLWDYAFGTTPDGTKRAHH
jgi:sterol desaturase/sphingolipid hydroxylase (fatty acid hydroxylase superfamily)